MITNDTNPSIGRWHIRDFNLRSHLGKIRAFTYQ